jgi:hypothetical protein
MTKLTPVGPFPTSRKFFEAGFENTWNWKEIAGSDPKDSFVQGLVGVRKLLDIIVDSMPLDAPRHPPPFEVLDEESAKHPGCPGRFFVLRHDDLDLQNVLVDYGGNVTGIVDWDDCMMVPRCIGYSSLPTSLRHD